MKKTLALFLVLLCTCTVFAQKYTSIKGKITGHVFPAVKLFKAVDGALHTMATTEPASDGSYGFLVMPEQPGFYALGDEKMKFLVYLKGGEEVNIDLEKTRAVLNGKNTKENKTLYVWNDYAETVRTKSVYFFYCNSNYKDFFPDFEQFIAGLPALKKKLKSGNADFDRQLEQLVQYETDYFAVSFLMSPRTAHPQKSDWPAYYATIISKDKFNTDEVMNYPEGARMMSVYTSFGILSSDVRPQGEEIVNKALSLLHTPRLKGEYLMNTSFRMCRTSEKYLEVM